MADEKPKIIVDDDWKKQAQAEKHKIAEETEKQAQQQEARQLPPADFNSLISMLATNSIFALGGMQDPAKGKVMVDPAMAKHYIDTMDMLKEKTKGNLSDEEAKMLEDALYQTQMLFVQISQKVAQAQKQQAQKPVADKKNEAADNKA